MKSTLIYSLCWSAALGLTVLTAAAAERSSVGVGKYFKGPVGLQLYSLRDDFKKDVPGTLAKARAFGFTYVELAGTYDLKPEAFKEALVKHQLKQVAGHFPFERLRDDIDGVARDAKALGLQYVGCAWIPHTGAFDEKTCREAAAVFNRAGQALAKQGMKFYYHNHGYEFQPFGQGTLLDLLMAETNPKFVAYEMDLFWTVLPGQDPVKLLQKFGPRWQLMHLKDIKKGVPLGDLTGHSDVTNDVALGTGQMNFPAILKAAKKTGVKWYFIEDESPSVAQQLPVSLRFLKQVAW